MSKTGNRISVAVIGYGYWGPNLARNFRRLGTDVRYICDLDESLRTLALKDCPNARFTRNLEDILHDNDVDAVCIATPVSTHFDIAMMCLKAGKHCLVEKPLADSSSHVQEMIALAVAQNLTLMTDHTYLYHGGIRKICELVKSGVLGPVMYYDSVRINLGLFQKDVNVIWDLATHDFSIMLYVLGRRPTSISASAVCHVEGRPESMAYVTCFFEDSLIVHFHVNWLAPVKIRKTIVGGLNKMIIFDELAADEQIKIYDRGVDTMALEYNTREIQISYRTGDMEAPQLDRTEPLGEAVRDFVESIVDPDRSPVSDGGISYDVIRMLEATEISHKQNGARVNIDWNGR